MQLPNLQLGGGLGAPMMPAGVPGGIPSPMAGTIMPSMNPGLPIPPPPGFADDLSMAKYEAVTQSDGSVLLHMKNPDGSLGPAIKIISPPKSSNKPQGA